MRNDTEPSRSADRSSSSAPHPGNDASDIGATVRGNGGATDKFTLLMQRPGVLIRRLQQIQSAMFLDETAAFDVTPLQFSLMTLLVDQPGLEQGVAATRLRLDRFTTASVVRRLEAAKYLRTKPGQDRRTKNLYLTARGLKIFDGLHAQAMRAHDRLVEPFPPDRRALFTEMLRELTDHYDAIGGPPKIR